MNHYTEEQIRAAGISGEISSIDVEHLINILKRENEVGDISAKDFWKQKLGFSPNANAEKFAVKMMEEYASIANYLPIQIFNLAFESWANKQNWQLHSSKEYYYRSKNIHSWPPDETIEISDLKKQFMKYASIVNERKDSTGSEEVSFQKSVNEWMQVCFGEQISADGMERNHRFLEESLELVQSLGCTKSEANQLVDYVFGRPKGEPYQELGGVMVTLAALSNAWKLSMDDCGETELKRIWTKVEQIREKQANKPKHSPLPQSQPEEESEKELEERTERNMVLVDAFCEHLKNENIVIPESAILSFFNA